LGMVGQEELTVQDGDRGTAQKEKLMAWMTCRAPMQFVVTTCSNDLSRYYIKMVIILLIRR